jgi:hypothetical protein
LWLIPDSNRFCLYSYHRSICFLCMCQATSTDFVKFKNWFNSIHYDERNFFYLICKFNILICCSCFYSMLYFWSVCLMPQFLFIASGPVDLVIQFHNRKTILNSPQICTQIATSSQTLKNCNVLSNYLALSLNSLC